MVASLAEGEVLEVEERTQVASDMEVLIQCNIFGFYLYLSIYIYIWLIYVWPFPHMNTVGKCEIQKLAYLTMILEAQEALEDW